MKNQDNVQKDQTKEHSFPQKTELALTTDHSSKSYRHANVNNSSMKKQ
jgi:hypothetical protein